MQPIKKAVFPVGGLGTRFLPATKAIPKEMLPVVDRPLIQYGVEEARDSGIEEFIFVTGRNKTAIEDQFDTNFELEHTLSSRGKTEALAVLDQLRLEPGAVSYVRQMEPLGLGHAVWCARKLVGDEPFAVLLADDLILGERPALAEMIDVYNQRGGNVIAVMDVPTEHTSRYGIVDPGSDDGHVVQVNHLVEKPAPQDAPSTIAVVGRYVLQSEVFTFLSEKLEGAGGEIQLTDALARLESPFHGIRVSGTRFDCGTKAGFLEANLAYALARDDMRAEVFSALERLGIAATMIDSDTL